MPGLRGRWRAAAWCALWAGLLVAAWITPRGPMFFKLVGLLAMPVGLIWMALAAATLEAIRRRRLRAACAATAAWVAFTAAGNGGIGRAWMAWLERGFEPVSVTSAELFDAVFVLGGGVDVDPALGPQLTHAGDRAIVGARLYHAGATPVLVASGSSPPGAAHAVDGAASTALVWAQLAVPPDAVITLTEPYNTGLELDAYASLARERGWRRVGLVTSAWHMRRALHHAERVGLPVTPLPCDFRGGPLWEGIYGLVPRGAGFDLVQMAAWETLGRIAAR